MEPQIIEEMQAKRRAFTTPRDHLQFEMRLRHFTHAARQSALHGPSIVSPERPFRSFLVRVDPDPRVVLHIGGRAP